MSRLGYTEEWLRYGFLTEKYILDQYDEIESSEDNNAEHYRGWAFHEYLSSKGQLTKIELENVFHLKDDGPDGCDLTIDRAFLLIESGILSYEQLENLQVDHPEFNERPLQKIYLRKLLIKKIEKYGINDETFESVKNCNDSNVHRYLLENNRLSVSQLEWFEKYGANKKIRNIAKNIKR